MAQEQSNSNGFTLPTPTDSAPATTAGTPVQVQPVDAVALQGSADTSSRDLLVGSAILLVLFVAFFFARNGFANSLVAKRVPPNKANTAGWWLFVFLASLATGVVLSAVNTARFMTPFIIGPVGVVALLSLALMFMTARK